MKDYLKLLKEAVGAEEGDQDIHAEIIKFFQGTPNPSDEEVHAFAEDMGINEHELERHIYMILSDVINGGKSANFKGDYDPAQLKKGTKVELEHTSNPLLAEKIAKDHLAELPDYYDRLQKMEEGAGVKHEIFIQMPEIEDMDGEERDRKMLRLSIVAELDAVNLYEKMANLTDNPDIEEVMLDVAKEEKEHAGEFESLLKRLDPEHEPSLKSGEEEVDDMLSGAEEKE